MPVMGPLLPKETGRDSDHCHDQGEQRHREFALLTHLKFLRALEAAMRQVLDVAVPERCGDLRAVGGQVEVYSEFISDGSVATLAYPLLVGGEVTKPRSADFKWRQFEPRLILTAVGWYLRFSLSYRDVEELLQERGMWSDYVTVWRWVQRYAPALDQRLRSHLKPSWRVDETYIRVKGKWTYLYRAVDSAGASIDFLLSAQRAAAAKRFFQKALSEAADISEDLRLLRTLAEMTQPSWAFVYGQLRGGRAHDTASTREM